MSGRRVRAQAALELRLLARNGENLLVTLGIPVGLLAFFSLVPVLPVPAGVAPATFLAPGIVTVGVMGAAMTSLGIATGFERSYLVLKRLGATPLRRGELIAAKVAAVLTIVAVQVVTLLAVSALLGWSPSTGPQRAAWPLAGTPVAVMLGVAAFAGIGLGLAGTLRAVANLAVVNALFVLLVLVSGLVFPLAALPAPLAATARLLPSGALGEVLRGLLGPGGAPVSGWLVLAAWAVAAPLVAARVFRWE